MNSSVKVATCKNGHLCKNLKDHNRPTRLSSAQTKSRQVCSYCQNYDTTIGQTDGRIVGPTLSHQTPVSQSNDNLNLNSSFSSALLPEISPIYGYDVINNLNQFVNSEAVPDIYKRSLIKFLYPLLKTKNLESYIRTLVASGTNRLKSDWVSGFGNVPEGKIKTYANQARANCKLIVDGSYSTFTALNQDPDNDHLRTVLSAAAGVTSLEDYGGLVIYANPVFAGALRDESIATVIAHEMVHHVDNHYKVSGDLMRTWLSEHPNATLEEKTHTKDLLNIVVDCLANDILGITHISVLDRNQISPRSILASAIAFGDTLKVDSIGSLYCEVVTIGKINANFGVHITSNDSIEVIFKKLLAADNNKKATGA